MTIYLIRGDTCICYKNCKELDQWLDEVESVFDLTEERSLTHNMTIGFRKKLYDLKYLNNLVQLHPIWLIKIVRKGYMFGFCYNPFFRGDCIKRSLILSGYTPTPNLTIKC